MTAAGRPELPGGRPPAWLAQAPPVDRPWIAHPLGVIELLDCGFSLLRTEWPSLGPAVVGAVLPLAMLSAWANREALLGQGTSDVFAVTLSTIGGHGSWVVVGVLITLLWPVVVVGPAARVATGWWYGRHIDRRTAAAGLFRMPGYLLAVVLVDLAVTVGFFVLFLPAVVVWVALHLTVPLMVVEGRNPFSAFSRSVQLSLRRFGPALGISLCVFLVGAVLSLLLSLLPDVLVDAVGVRWGFPVLAAGFLAVHVVIWTWEMLTLSLFALDLRARTEGLDLLLRAPWARAV